MFSDVLTKLIKAEKEIETLKEQLGQYQAAAEAEAKEVDSRGKEIKTLREQNDKCHELRLKFIDEQIVVIREKDKQIKSLRDDLEKAEERCSQWADIAGENGAEKDEWKQVASKAAQQIESLREQYEVIIAYLSAAYEDLSAEMDAIDR